MCVAVVFGAVMFVVVVFGAVCVIAVVPGAVLFGTVVFRAACVYLWCLGLWYSGLCVWLWCLAPCHCGVWGRVSSGLCITAEPEAVRVQLSYLGL